MEQKTWKKLAIVFITLFILETIFLTYIFSIGLEDVEMEEECYYNICDELSDEYTAWYYDDYTNMCICYTADGTADTTKLRG